MKSTKIAFISWAFAMSALWTPTPALAVCDGCVVGAIGTMTATLGKILYNIGSTISQSSNKIANTVEAASRSQREFAAQQEQNRRLEDARQRYQVPASICSESGSGGVSQYASSSGATKGSMRPGGGAKIANTAIAQAVNSPAPAPETDASRSAKVHAQFCDADDYAAYGGAKACPSVSAQMPGADKRVDSLNYGAGPEGKAPELTFTQAQSDAARMYTQNTIRRSIAPQLRKGEADTVAGAQYVGLMNQFNAVLSAAADPQERRIADSQPSTSTAAALKEALTAQSAQSYFNDTASPTAKSTQTMSYREFLAFDVGRRYANTAYQADLQEMSGDNLVRELVRVNAQTNWLLLELHEDAQRGNIVNGQILASLARAEYGPVLTQKYRQVAGRLGGQ